MAPEPPGTTNCLCKAHNKGASVKKAEAEERLPLALQQASQNLSPCRSAPNAPSALSQPSHQAGDLLQTYYSSPTWIVSNERQPG